MSENEAEFHEVVGAALEERYRMVEHEPTLDSGREPDFIVDTWLYTLAIEVEHHPTDVTDDVIHGAGQAACYAGEIALDRQQTGVVPVVICNADAFDPAAPEIRGLRAQMPVVPLSE